MPPWPKGVSGNPAGGRRGPRTISTARLLFSEHRQVAVETMVELATGAEDERVRLAAAMAILDRSDGKPREAKEDDEEQDKQTASNPETARVMAARILGINLPEGPESLTWIGPEGDE